MAKFDQIYQNLLTEIMTKGIAEKNQRTGHETKALPGVHFQVDLEQDGFPLLTLRKIPVPMFVAEQFTGTEGKYVKIEDTVRAFREILDGKHDTKSEQAFYMKGGIEEVI